jgi:hypothetical protein
MRLIKVDSTAASLICGKTMLHIAPNPFADHNMKLARYLKTSYCSGINIFAFA